MSVAAPRSLGTDNQPLIDYALRRFYGDIQGPASVISGAFTADSFIAKSGPWIDATHPSFGVKFDGRQVADLSIANGSPLAHSASGLFKPTDVGLIVELIGGGIVGVQSGTIASFQSTTDVTLSFNANHAGVNVVATWGSGNAAAFERWLAVVIPTSASAGQAGAAIGAHGLMPAGMALLERAIAAVDQANLGGFQISGAGLGGAGGGPTVIRATAGFAATETMLTVNNMRNAVWRCFMLDGFGGTAKRGISSTMGTTGPPPAPPSGETSTNNRFEDVYIQGCNDWQLYLDGTEDTKLIGVHLAALAGSLDANALFVNVPSGAASLTCSFIAGILNLNYQTFGISHSTVGPILINNPNSLITLALSLFDTYHYDSASHYCIGTVDRFTDIDANGAFFILSNQADWIRGVMLAGVTCIFNGCGFLTSATLAGATVYCFSSESGQGGILFVGCSASATATQTSRNAFRAITGAAVALALTPFGNTFIMPLNMVVAGGTAWPVATGVTYINPYPFAAELIINLAGVTVTGNGLEISNDAVTWVSIGLPALAYPTVATITKRLPAGQAVRLNFSAGAPKYAAAIAA